MSGVAATTMPASADFPADLLRCYQCGYARGTLGSSDRCPECGTIPPTDLIAIHGYDCGAWATLATLPPRHAMFTAVGCAILLASMVAPGFVLGGPMWALAGLLNPFGLVVLALLTYNVVHLFRRWNVGIPDLPPAQLRLAFGGYEVRNGAGPLNLKPYPPHYAFAFVAKGKRTRVRITGHKESGARRILVDFELPCDVETANRLVRQPLRP